MMMMTLRIPLLLIALCACSTSAFAPRYVATTTSSWSSGGGALTLRMSDSATTDPFDSFKIEETKTIAIREVVMGDGDLAKDGDICFVKYDGKLMATGEGFGEGTFSFKLGEPGVMPGFNLGVKGLRVGGKRKLRVPANLGYGSRGQKTIPPNADLEFDIELEKVSSGAAAEFMMEWGLGNNRKTYGLAAILLFLALSPMLDNL